MQTQRHAGPAGGSLRSRRVLLMAALDVWGGSKLGKEAEATKPTFERFGLYTFLIAFACVYYLLNTSLMLGHYDLGWHLAAGDLIREQGHVPFQDPWSFTLGDK